MALSRGLSKAIGLSTEAYAHHQDKKKQKDAQTGAGEGAVDNNPLAAPTPSQGRPGSSGSNRSDTDDLHDEDEFDWIRDETEAQLQPESRQETVSDNNQDVDSLVADFNGRHPLPLHANNLAQLANPVIIPQRRPGTKFRGFVPAYAPALDACGVDERSFMDFHEGMHKAVHKQGWFHVSNIAAGLAALSYTVAVAPSVIVHFTAIAVHTSIEASRRLWMAKQTNSYFDQMNETYFKPRGLFALIMTYKPDSQEEEQLVDVRTHISSSVAGRDAHQRSGFKTSSGKTHGEAQMPEAAALVFPKLDKADDEQKMNAFKRASEFMSAYGDKRAQAEFQNESPNSQLNVTPKPEWSSIFADPNHPVNKGLVPMLRGSRQRDRNGLISAHREARGRSPLNLGRRRGEGGQGGLGGLRAQSRGKGESKGALGSAKRMMHEDVLYLMIVPMPSEAELEAAGELMKQAKKAGFK